ncbi:hypothetical protein GCM10008940_21930 [Microbulbifer agarilyticus]
MAELSIDNLREQNYSASLQLLERVKPAPQAGVETVLASYLSDGLRIYTRIDIPTAPPPADGYPVVIFAHGWIGIDKAPNYHFGLDKDSLYGELVNDLAGDGFIVLSPGYRGHGTIQGEAAAGLEYMRAWDNGSYLSPSFYAIDTVNLFAALPSLSETEWQFEAGSAPHLDLNKVNLMGHSQGGDVVLTALAITGNNPGTPEFHAASIWAGNVADKFTQANTFGPMGTTAQAFLAGDGSWTGTATGDNGTVNPDFIFGFPPNWIGNPDPKAGNWTWQYQSWPTPSVKQALENKYQQMYDTINQHVLDITDAKFQIRRNSDGKLETIHDVRVTKALNKTSAYPKLRHISTPLALHFSDRDYYSLPVWNQRIQTTLRARGDRAYAFEYPGTTHGLKVSEKKWFSPAGTISGVPCAIARDNLLFTGKDPQQYSCKSAESKTKDLP